MTNHDQTMKNHDRNHDGNHDKAQVCSCGGPDVAPENNAVVTKVLTKTISLYKNLNASLWTSRLGTTRHDSRFVTTRHDSSQLVTTRLVTTRHDSSRLDSSRLVTTRHDSSRLVTSRHRCEVDRSNGARVENALGVWKIYCARPICTHVSKRPSTGTRSRAMQYIPATCCHDISKKQAVPLMLYSFMRDTVCSVFSAPAIPFAHEHRPSQLNTLYPVTPHKNQISGEPKQSTPE